MIVLVLYASIKTWWSDESPPKTSEPMEAWFADWILCTYGDAAMWKGQVRPVRAIRVDLHYFAEPVGPDN
jgi:hypothetical protein